MTQSIEIQEINSQAGTEDAHEITAQMDLFHAKELEALVQGDPKSAVALEVFEEDFRMNNREIKAREEAWLSAVDGLESILAHEGDRWDSSTLA
jgi:hypothetical protein